MRKRLVLLDTVARVCFFLTVAAVAASKIIARAYASDEQIRSSSDNAEVKFARGP